MVVKQSVSGMWWKPGPSYCLVVKEQGIRVAKEIFFFGGQFRRIESRVA